MNPTHTPRRTIRAVLSGTEVLQILTDHLVRVRGQEFGHGVGALMVVMEPTPNGYQLAQARIEVAFQPVTP